MSMVLDLLLYAVGVGALFTTYSCVLTGDP